MRSRTTRRQTLAIIAGLLVLIAGAVLLEGAREALAREEANARRVHRYINHETDPRALAGPRPNP